MKKRVISALLCLCMALALLPTTALADYKYKIKTMDVTIEAPTAGMTLAEGRALKLLSVQTEYGELVSTGGAMLVGNIQWSGEFDRTDSSNPKFQAGMTYTATIQINLSYEQGYWVNHGTDASGDNIMDSNYVKLTVNGVPTEITMGTAGNPKFKVDITIPAPGLSDEEKAAAEAARLEKFKLRYAALRDSAEAYTTAEADALWVEKQAYDTIILNMDTLPERLYHNYEDIGYLHSDIFDESLNPDYITGILMDFDLDIFDNEEQAENFVLLDLVFGCDNLKEIWLSDKVDAVWFLKALKESTEGQYHHGETWYWTNSTSFGTGDATLYIPSSAAEAVRAAYDDEIRLGEISPCFSIKIYDGDVYAAQKAGGGAARDYCTNHKYTEVIMAADRIANLDDCSRGLVWYYSCAICGKCEYNDNHTISRSYSYNHEVPKAPHDYSLKLANEEAYVGVNAAGDLVYWYSCTYCGKPYNYHREHPTQEDCKNSGMDMTFEQYRQYSLSSLAERESAALNHTTAQVGMFTLSTKSAAKTSVWAQSDVNFALDNGLLDTELLGNNYTKPITRLQFCSVAVRLAEVLTGKEITPAPNGTFKDTDNLYVRKAYAAGITAGTTATTFEPNGTLTRQQMATFIYRALQYVEKNSDHRYTDYVSRLSSYTDSKQIQSWATESMAFMNALDLVKGTSATALSPNGTCTIEQAVAVAYRSLYAHQIGWYQATESVRYQYAAEGNSTYISLDKGERIWVTGNRMGAGVDDTWLDNLNGEYSSSYCYYPVVEPRTGEVCYIEAAKLKPIRD